MENSDLKRYAKEAFQQMARDVEHPSIDEMAELVRGHMTETRREQMKKHLSECASCREQFADLEQFIVDSERPAGRDLSAEWRDLQKRLWGMRARSASVRWGAVAASLLLVASLPFWIPNLLAPSPSRLLAEAYHEQRTSEFRLAAAGYAELHQERASGSAFARPAALLKAQVRIQEDLKLHGNDPALLRLEGEAQIIGGDAPGAVQTLKRALELRSDDPKILADLGAAYGVLGDVEHDPDHYKHALDFLGRTQRLNPNNLEVNFNRAVVLEKLMVYDQAEIAWKDYLKADKSSDWAKEARRRLAAIEQKMQQRERRLGQVRDDPGHFLKLADANNIDAEVWLVSPVPVAWLQRSATDANARQAILRLAEILAREHGDTWLLDMTTGSCSGSASSSALGKLITADALANGGRYESALASEKEITADFLRTGCIPGAAQSRLLEVAALESLEHQPECLASAEQLGHEIESRPYLRLRWRIAKEYALCAMRSGLLDQADAAVEKALRLTQMGNYGAARLDLRNNGLDKTTYSGLPSQMVSGAAESLRVFWSGAYARSLAYFPLYELRLYAARVDEKNAAADFARAAVWAMSGDDALIKIRVGAYTNLAAAERQLGDLQAAAADLKIGFEIAHRVPVQYQVGPAADVARFDLDRGDASVALERLMPLASVASSTAWVTRANYYTTLGDALARQGSLDDAMAAFRKVIDSAAGYLATVRSEDERSGVLKGVENACRGLVAVQLAIPGNEAVALRTWQSMRYFDPLPGAGAAGVPDDPVLWFVELPDGFVAWFSDRRQVVFHRISVPKAIVVGTAKRFSKESSDPLSSPQTVQDDARQLYQWMLEPFESRLKTSGNLVFDLDGALAGLPLQSLISPDGRYLCERFSVLISSGRSGRRASDPGKNARVLLIANPAIAGVSAARFPPLADSVREVEAIRASFANCLVLEGRAASIDSLARELRRSEIFHFAGHGYSSSGYGALLLAPKDPATADFQLLRAAEMRGMVWLQCRLAVLSACAAAEGETHGTHNPDSLIRGLTRAGVPRIAASLWNVDSAASAELMTKFYRFLGDGRSTAEALRAAQQTIRLTPRWRQPYYWAGFQLYGTI